MPRPPPKTMRPAPRKTTKPAHQCHLPGQSGHLAILVGFTALAPGAYRFIIGRECVQSGQCPMRNLIKWDLG